MILDKILGYWVTDDPDVLTAFIAQAHERYDALAQTLEPIRDAVVDLERDWTPRPADFWQQATAALTVVSEATKTTLQLFAREQSSPTAPFPLILVAPSISYRCSLHQVESKIEETGIRLTAHSGAACSSSLSETTIRQRQRVLGALQALDKAGCEAVTEGRARLNEALEQQGKIACPRRPAQPQQEPAASSPGDAAVKKDAAEQQPTLRIVRSEQEGKAQ